MRPRSAAESLHKEPEIGCEARNQQTPESRLFLLSFPVEQQRIGNHLLAGAESAEDLFGAITVDRPGMDFGSAELVAAALTNTQSRSCKPQDGVAGTTVRVSAPCD